MRLVFTESALGLANICKYDYFATYFRAKLYSQVLFLWTTMS